MLGVHDDERVGEERGAVERIRELVRHVARCSRKIKLWSGGERRRIHADKRGWQRCEGGGKAWLSASRGGAQHLGLGPQRTVEEQERGWLVEAGEAGWRGERKRRSTGCLQARLSIVEQADDESVDAVLADKRRRWRSGRLVHVDRRAQICPRFDDVHERQRFHGLAEAL